jgi:hypothetical protein
VKLTQGTISAALFFASLHALCIGGLQAQNIEQTFSARGSGHFQLGADWFQMPGVACDGRESALKIVITSGSNTSNVGALLTAADVGKTFFFTNKSGYGFGFKQSVWTAKLQSYSFPNATWSANAPFSENAQVYYGTDNLSAINAAMAQANAVFPLTIPTGCSLLANGTIPWNNSQVIVGRHLAAGGFIGRPGADVIATTDKPGQRISSPGAGLKGFAIVNGSEIDATFGYTLYAANGSATLVPPLYRPAYQHTPLANHPCAPGWFIGCRNGVATTTQNSAVICTPKAITPPAVGSTIVFPYAPKVFTSTVASTAGSCTVGFTARTMVRALPNVTGYTVAQNEWFAGTSVQTITDSIPGTPSYPFTVHVSQSIASIPGWVSNFSQFGHAKLQDYEFDYMGADPIAGTITIRRGPASVNGGAGYTGPNPAVPLNPCPAKFDNPWPITPTINSRDSTPPGANWFPGQCVGNAAIAFPTANGNTYTGSGLVDGFLEDIDFLASSVQNQNNIAMVYVAGNNAPFASTFANLKGQGYQYGYVQGPASSGQHGVAAVGPTGFGNTFHNIHFFDAFPLAFVDMQGSTVDELNLNSTMVSPYDGTAIGSATCLQEGYTLDERTGGVVTSTQFNAHHVYGCEPENGSHIVVLPAVIIDSSHSSFDTANFEGIPNVFSGDHLKLTNSELHLPAINYGTDNDFGVLAGGSAFYSTNVWNVHPEFYNWGINSTCSMYTGSLGGPPVGCAPGMPQGYSGRSISGSVTGTKEENPEGGKMTPGEWNTNGGFDSAPMSVSNVVDPTEPFWGRYAGCNLGGTALCHPAAFDGIGGYIYIGPHQRLADQPYLAQMDLMSATAGGQVQVVISALDSGARQCSSAGAIASQAFTTTTSWNDLNHPFTLPVDFTGHAGCILQIQFFNATTTDQYRVGYFNFVPIPGGVLGPATAPKEGSACSRNSTWLGAAGGFAYFCDGGTVKRTPIS